MTEPAEKVPNPGSDEALRLGCTCAVLDNNYGRGFPWGGGPSFLVNTECPLHRGHHE
mgnify:CR=1 FL=1